MFEAKLLLEEENYINYLVNPIL